MWNDECERQAQQIAEIESDAAVVRVSIEEMETALMHVNRREGRRLRRRIDDLRSLLDKTESILETKKEKLFEMSADEVVFDDPRAD